MGPGDGRGPPIRYGRHRTRPDYPPRPTGFVRGLYVAIGPRCTVDAARRSSESFGVPAVKTVATRPRRGNHQRGELSADSARGDLSDRVPCCSTGLLARRCGGLSLRLEAAVFHYGHRPHPVQRPDTSQRRPVYATPHSPTTTYRPCRLGVTRAHHVRRCLVGRFVPPDESGDVWADRWR